jgi:hypothetical protein
VGVLTEQPILVASTHNAGKHLRPRLLVKAAERSPLVGVSCEAVEEHDPVGSAVCELLLKRRSWQH